MSVQPPENPYFSGWYTSDDALLQIHRDLNTIARYVQPGDALRPEVVRWYETEIPDYQQVVEDIDGQEIPALFLEAEQLVPDSKRHTIWRFRFADNPVATAGRLSIWNVSASNGTEALLLSTPAHADETAPPLASFEPATQSQIYTFDEEHLSGLRFEVEMFSNRRHPYAPEGSTDYEFHVEELRRTQANIPGIAVAGVLLDPPYYSDLL